MFSFTKRPEVDVAKTTASRKLHGMRAVCKLSSMKIWKRSKRVCWTKITIIYNLGNVYQTKDIQPWSESLKSVQVWVIEKSYNCALAHCSCKNTAENFDRHVTDVVTVKIIFDKNSISFPIACCGCLGISSSWMYGADCWPVWDSRTENILVSDSSSESPRPSWWFFVAGKDSSLLQLGSKYSTPSRIFRIFRKDRIVGVSWRWFSRPGRLKKRPT